MTVTDQKGRSIEIELIALSGDSVTFSRKGAEKEYTLPITHFLDASQDLIRKQAVALPPPPSKIRPDVVMGKRRHKNGSYYMVQQDVTCTVKLTNPDPKAAAPPMGGTIVFFGENTRTHNDIKVLSIQNFEASIAPSKTFVKEMEPFETSFDSDNKGYGNSGGYQYYGFLLVLTNDEEKVVLTFTTTGSIKKAIKDNDRLVKKIIAYRNNEILSEKLESKTAVRNGR